MHFISQLIGSQGAPPSGTRESGQYYERRGLQATRRIAQAVASKSWKWTLLNLAWTVGPVTFIALQVGSYVGLGKAAPNQTFVYFAVYTLVAGSLAMIASVMHDAFTKPKVKAEQKRLLDIIDQMFSLVLATRNEMLEALEPSERRIMSAYYILNGAGISPSAVGTAVQDLTQSAKLAKYARRADVFAEQGMMSRIHDDWSQVLPLLEAVRPELESVAPQAYRLLELRLRGIAPQVQHGIERKEGFIERTLAAADTENEALMTLHDAYEMLVLVFELLNGRRIAMLDVRFEGDSRFERAQQAFDEARQAYRKSLRARNSRIRLMAEKLYQETGCEVLIDATDSIERLVRMLQTALGQLSPAERQRYKRAYEEGILRRHRLARQRYDYLLRVERVYRRTRKREGEKLGVALQSKSLKQNGFVITEEEITLFDRQKLRLVQGINLLLKDVEIRSGRSLAVYDTSDESKVMRFTAEDYKQLAMGIGHLLDELIDLSRPEQQQAIESSNMANFASLDRDLSPQTKAGWAATMVEALHANRRKASHRLARNLVRFYRVQLSQEMREYFVERFGANPDYLDTLHLEAEYQEDQPEYGLPAAPYPLPAWKQLFDESVKLVPYS